MITPQLIYSLVEEGDVSWKARYAQAEAVEYDELRTEEVMVLASSLDVS